MPRISDGTVVETLRDAKTRFLEDRERPFSTADVGTPLVAHLRSQGHEVMESDVRSAWRPGYLMADINQPIDLPSDPIRTNQGIVLYMICDRQSGDDEALSRTAIADRLGQQRLETLARGYLSDLRRAAVIDIRL